MSWNKPFKAAYLRFYETWLESSGSTVANRTTAGNARPPSKYLVCQWVVEAWKSITKELVQKSFRVCGLTTDLDGSKDDEILAVRELGLQQQLTVARESAPRRDIEDEVSSDESVVGENPSELESESE